jgi:uncharacterized membrane protein
MRFINMTRRNAKRALGALLMAMAVGAVAPAAQADAAYEIKPRHSGKCLDVAYGGQWDGFNVQQWSCNGQFNQQFNLEYSGSGYYRIVARHSGKCLDVAYGSTGDYANIQQWTCNGGSNQQFSLRDLNNGYYKLVARHSGKCIDVENRGTGDGTNVIQYTCHSGNWWVDDYNQQFRFAWR